MLGNSFCDFPVAEQKDEPQRLAGKNCWDWVIQRNSPQIHHLVWGLFWSEGNWEKANTRKSLSHTSIYLKEAHKITQGSIFPFLVGRIEITGDNVQPMSVQRQFSPEEPTKHSLLISPLFHQLSHNLPSPNFLQRMCTCVGFAVLQVLNVLQSPH